MNELWKTDNMSLAAYLKLNVPLVKTEWNNSGDRRSCYWFFEDTEFLADLVTEFMGGEASVDPREYNSTIAGMKKEMFSLEDA